MSQPFATYGEASRYLEAAGVRDFVGSREVFGLARALYRLIGPDPARVREALRLRELVERADEAGRGIEIDPPGDKYLIRLEPGEWIERASLAEAAEAALEELDS